MNLVELPWGDYVVLDHVVGITIESEDDGLSVHVLTTVEGLRIASPPSPNENISADYMLRTISALEEAAAEEEEEDDAE